MAVNGNLSEHVRNEDLFVAPETCSQREANTKDLVIGLSNQLIETNTQPNRNCGQALKQKSEESSQFLF